MKLIIFFCALFSCQIYAQSYGEVEYIYLNNIVNYKSKAILKFTPTRSHYILLKSQELKEEVKTADDTGNIQIRVPDGDNRPEFYLDRASNSILSLEYLFREIYLVNEKISVIKWKITQEFKDLNSLKCQKAIGYFRGRTYTAWFATDIPVPYGPWKLQGLPGLILEAYDEKKLIVFRISKYTPMENGEIIVMTNATKKMQLKEFLTEEIPKKRKEIDAYVSSLNTDRNTTIVSSKSYYPPSKELIYEWEENYPKQE